MGGWASKAASTISLMPQSLCLLPLSDVNKHIDCSDHLPLRTEHGCWVGQEVDTCSVRPLSNRLDASHGALLAHRDCHRALIVGKKLTRFGVQLPSDAPIVLSHLRLTSSETNARTIVIGDHPIRV